MVFNASENLIFIGIATGKIVVFTFPEINSKLVCTIGNSGAIFDYCPKGFIYIRAMNI